MTMHRIDRVLPPLFDELADPRTPDYLEAAIELASSRPQRPAWTFPGRWLPVQISTSAAPVARFPWRQVGVLAIIGILIAVAAVAVVGTARPPDVLPAPLFGQAQNGRIAVALDGDIATIDPVSGDTTRIVSGPELDSAPQFSRDGTTLVFRRDDGGASVIMVAKPDGSDLRQATPEPLPLMQEGWSLSPDGTELLLAAMVGEQSEMRYVVQPVDGGEATVLDVQLPSDPGRVEPASFRPTDPSDILYMATDVTTMRGIYVYDRVTGKTETIRKPTPGIDAFGAAWSPNGNAITFGTYDPNAMETSARMQIATGGGELPRPVDAAPGTAYDIQSSDWSNDGTRVVVNRVYSDGRFAQSVIVTPAGHAAPLELACGAESHCPNGWYWSPDDTQLIGVIDDPVILQGEDVQYVTADPTTGAISPLEWTGGPDLAWQRTGGLAPTD
jgi:Tol biopolymer transport system component